MGHTSHQNQQRQKPCQEEPRETPSTSAEPLADWTQYLLFAINFLTEGFVYTYAQTPEESHKLPLHAARRIGSCQMHRIPRVNVQ